MTPSSRWPWSRRAWIGSGRSVASGAHKTFLGELGVDTFIDYTQERPEDVAHDVDIVLDCVGGPDSQRLLPVLKRGGAMFPVYLADFDPNEIEQLDITVSLTQVRSSGRQAEQIAQLINNGVLRPGIDSVYPLADASEAHRRAARGHIQGKIVLSVS